MGPEGPPGESGPGTRLVLSGVFGDDGVASQILPPEAGTLADPPAATCWVSLDSQLWLSNPCVLAFDVSGSLIVGTLLLGIEDPAGWMYRIVVVY